MLNASIVLPFVIQNFCVLAKGLQQLYACATVPGKVQFGCQAIEEVIFVC